MPLQELRVRCFQSLVDVKLELAQFTVIVGPSNSGKSALVRAIHALINNVSGSSAVTAGKRTFLVDARTSSHAIRLERGPGKSEYVMRELPASPNDHTDPIRFTKAGKDVPAEVSAIFGMSSINFAKQFDKPYLLDDSAGDVARVLGALTNIDKIFAAQREANARATRASSELKTRTADLEKDRENLSALSYLASQRDAIARASSVLDELEEVERDLDQIRSLRATLETALTAKASATASLGPPPPDLSSADKVAQGLTRLSADRAAAQRASAEVDQAQTALRQALENLQEAESLMTAALEEAGSCPLCGQSTRGAAVAVST